MAIDLKKLEQKFNALIEDENFVSDFEKFLKSRNVSQYAANNVLAVVKFTSDELSLLQRILVCLNDRLDWNFDKNNGLIEANVLLDFEESVPGKINNIYNKLVLCM